MLIPFESRVSLNIQIDKNFIGYGGLWKKIKQMMILSAAKI